MRKAYLGRKHACCTRTRRSITPRERPPPYPNENPAAPHGWTSMTASVERNIRRRHHAMATKDGFYPGDPLPLFLSTDEPEQNSTDQPNQNTGNDRPVILLRVLKAGILVV